METRKIEMQNKVNRAFMATKRFVMLAGILCSLLIVSEKSLAGSSYYACLEASVGNPSNVGKVYVGTSENASQADRVYGYTASSSTENGTTTLKAWAYPATGYELYKWEFVSAVRYTKTKNSNHTAADITGTESPLSVTLCCPSGSKDKSDLSSILTVRAVFWRPGGVNVDKLTFRTTEHGKYSVRSIAKDGVEQTTYDYTDIYDTKKEVSNVITGMPIDCRATADDGYIFYSYYTLDKYGNKAYVGDLLEPKQVILIEDDVVELGAEFTDNAFRIGDTFVKTLSDALQFVRTSENKTIQVVRSHEIPTGYYTIPAGVTLLIPYDVRHTTPKTVIERYDNNASIPKTNYRKLSLPSGAHLDVFGAIEVGGRQNCYDNIGTGRPVGTYYGQLDMAAGSTITLETGANLYAWGFVTGAGEIDVRRGANVHEQFQIYDWHGGGQATTFLGNNYGAFVVNQYCIQNVEAPAKYRPGSSLYCYTGLVGVDVDGVKVIGVEGDDAALFQMKGNDDSEDTWVRKYYKIDKDQQIYEVNNAAKLGNLLICYDDYCYNSSNYTLPITNNMKIHLLKGDLHVTQNTILLPGAEIEIDKTATAYIDPNMSLFLVDSADWGKWVFNGVYAQRVECRPDNAIPTDTQRKIINADKSSALPSARLNIHGTFMADGNIYTSYAYYIETDKTGATSNMGASIISTNDDAGTIIFNHKAPTTDKSAYVRRYKDAWPEIKCVSAKLKNTDGTYVTTAGTDSLKSYCYLNDKWTRFTVDPDSIHFVYDQDGIYYAKPAAYVAINATKNMSTKLISGNADHTYSDANGQGRLFILTKEGQWWEVRNVNNLYYCDDTETSFVWNETEKNWEEKKYAISWVDYDGTPLKNSNNEPIVYHLPYGAQPKFLSTSPTRAADIDYYYDFKGWSPEITVETKVTGDQTYTAVYNKIAVKYEIIFKYEEGIKQGSVIKREFLAREEMPTPPILNPIEGYESYKWTPAIAAVKGNQTYEAKWVEEAPAEYEIRFVDYDGTELQKGMVTASTMPTPPTNPNNKANTAEYAYEFDHWQPAVANAVADATYTAVYKETERTYAVRFFIEDGSMQIGETQNLTFGANPVVPAYSKENPVAGRTYRLKWINMSTSASVGVSVPSVSGAADYRAAFDETVNRYTITLNCKNESEEAVVGCNFSGAGTYDYGTSLTLTATAKEGFQFLRWSDGNTNASRTITVTQNASYTAIVEELPSIILKVGETMVVDEPTEVYEFVIRSNGDNSSSITGSNNISISTGGHAYFDLLLYAQRRHWKAFTVPFEIDLKQHPILADGVSMPLGVQYDIIYYDGAVRAAQGKVPDCWKYVEDQTDWILTPGVAYMIVFGRDVNTVRFTKKDGVSVAYDGTVSVAANNGASDDVNGGWNGIGNPATYHAMLNAGVGVTTCQVHNGEEIGSDGYITCDMGKFIVGKAVFVQVAASQSVVVNPASSSDPKIAAAPRRTNANTSGKNRFDVQIIAENGKMADRMFLLADEDKEDKYVILQDLAKAGLSTKCAQIWVDRYGTKLCKNTAVLTNGQAEYPLGIFAPAAGDYTIQVAERPDEETTLYLTFDGQAIWNLTYGSYVASLEKGTTSRYGLRLVRNTPQVATGMDEAVVDAKGETRKVLINDQVFIIRGENVYTIDGQMVK